MPVTIAERLGGSSVLPLFGSLCGTGLPSSVSPTYGEGKVAFCHPDASPTPVLKRTAEREPQITLG